MKLLHSLLSALALALFVPLQAAEIRPPNVIFVFADDLGFGDLGCYGHPYARTPAIDKLAAEGTSFRQFYVTGVTCCPSRTGFMTSRHPASFPKYMADYGFAGKTTVTELLKKRGYRTGHFGKWHMGPDEADGTYGLDTVKVIGANKTSEGGRDEGLFEAATRWIEKNRDVPFYVNIWGHITHFPVGPVPSLANRFKDVEFKRSDFGRHMQDKFDNALAIEGDLAAGMRNYLGDVYSLDLQVGRLLKKLDDLGLRENTIVVFSSDHGPAPVKLAGDAYKDSSRVEYSRNMLGYAGGLRGGKHNQFEGGVRAPFIIRWPGQVPAGKVNETSIFSGFDWLPTLCNIAGITLDPKAAGMIGENVIDIWKGADRSREEPLLWRVSSENGKPSIRDGKWKLHASGNPRGPVTLYDLSQDPSELNDVSKENPRVVANLRAKIGAWVATLPKSYAKNKKTAKKNRRRKK
ncbi:MAG: arylsulfatase A-like enzyme [Yoonia sp.]|jgi:arylsulfatase A-like enzyme